MDWALNIIAALVLVFFALVALVVVCLIAWTIKELVLATVRKNPFSSAIWTIACGGGIYNSVIHDHLSAAAVSPVVWLSGMVLGFLVTLEK